MAALFGEARCVFDYSGASVAGSTMSSSGGTCCLCALCVSYELVTASISSLDRGHDAPADVAGTKPAWSELQAFAVGVCADAGGKASRNQAATMEKAASVCLPITSQPSPCDEPAPPAADRGSTRVRRPTFRSTKWQECGSSQADPGGAMWLASPTRPSSAPFTKQESEALICF